MRISDWSSDVCSSDLWLSALTRNGHGMESETALSPQDKATEALLMGLRLEEGVDLARISSLSGVATDALVDRAAVERLSALGLIKCECGRLGRLDRKSVEEGESVSERVDLGGRRNRTTK